VDIIIEVVSQISNSSESMVVVIEFLANFISCGSWFISVALTRSDFVDRVIDIFTFADTTVEKGEIGIFAHVFAHFYFILSFLRLGFFSLNRNYFFVKFDVLRELL
jgi:hypothetical protein